MSQVKAIALLILLTVNPILWAQEPTTLRTGDLLFQSTQLSSMEHAISTTTGHYTHVALVERDSTGMVYVIEAIPSQGVRRVPLTQAWGTYDIYRLTVPFDSTEILQRAKSLLNLPYDEAFLPNNEAFYCSELIHHCYLDRNGIPLFEAHPMNFRDAKGHLPRYWRRHFRRLHLPVPEGIPGTNPTNLSHSPLLQRITHKKNNTHISPLGPL